MPCVLRACDAKKDVHDATGLKQSSRRPKNDKLPCPEDLRHTNNMREPHPRTLEIWRSVWHEAYPECMSSNFFQVHATILGPLPSLGSDMPNRGFVDFIHTGSIEPLCGSDLGILEKYENASEPGDRSLQMTCVETPPSPTVAKTKQKPEATPPKGMAIHWKIRGKDTPPVVTSDCRLCMLRPPARPTRSTAPSHLDSCPPPKTLGLSQAQARPLRIRELLGLYHRNKFSTPRHRFEGPGTRPSREHDIKVGSMENGFAGQKG